MQRILITGANGFIAQWAARAFWQEGFHVKLTGRGAYKLPFPQDDTFHYETLDITLQDHVKRCVDRFKPAVVFHAAALGAPDYCELHKDECDLVNVAGTQYVIDACRAADVHLVFTSTDFVFSGKDGPYKEDDPRAPVNYYGISKFKGEDLLAGSGISFTIVRLCSVYGFPYGGTARNVVTFVKERLEKGIPMKIVADQVRTPTYVGDVTQALLETINRKATGVFNLGGPETLTPYDIAIQTANHFGLDAGLIEKVDSTVFKEPAQRPRISGFVIDKARVELGFEPITLGEALARMPFI